MLRVLLLTVVLFVFITGGARAQTQPDLIEALSGYPELSTLVALLEQAELVSALASAEAVTIFAPTNDAFAAFSPSVLNYLNANPDLLARILSYHAVPGALDSAAVLAESSLPTLADEALEVNAALGRVNGASLLETDIPAANAIIHIISGVLLPTISLPPADALISIEPIRVGGSSTVRPLTERIRDLFEREGFAGSITVDENGTTVGLERFCVNGEIDIANASRRIRSAEVEACRANGIEPVEFFVAIDALAVTVSRDNDFIQSLTREQLAQIFTGALTTWDQVDPAYPAEPIRVYSPGADSGTFNYFVEAVVARGLNLEGSAAEAALLASPVAQFSEDDNVLVRGVDSNPFAIGYFGYAYYIANQERLRTVAVDGIEPNEATAESGAYPLARPLFIYSSPSIMQAKPQVAQFINFYINTAASQLGTEPGQIGYFPVNRDILNLDRLEWLAAMAAE
jgi:phosphate binding protein